MRKAFKRIVATLATVAVLTTGLVTTGVAEELDEVYSEQFTYNGVLCEGYGTNYATNVQNLKRIELNTWIAKKYAPGTLSAEIVHVDWYIQTSTGSKLSEGLLEKKDTNSVTYAESFSNNLSITSNGYHSSSDGYNLLFSGNTVEYA